MNVSIKKNSIKQFIYLFIALLLAVIILPTVFINMAENKVPDNLNMGNVTLNVADLNKVKDFYTKIIGMKVIEESDSNVILGTGSTPLVTLVKRSDLNFPAVGSTGLYHTAILLPSKEELVKLVKNILTNGQEFFIGSSDHLVSEAFYLEDPEGNGVEVYRDRPREEWQWIDGKIAMGSKYIDPFIYSAGVNLSTWQGIPDGTKVGHVHLKVGDIAQAKEFYNGLLEFDITAEMPTALFLSAGGYHHHLGMNIWESQNGNRVNESLGLNRFVINSSDKSYVDRIKPKLTEVAEVENGIEFKDPWGNVIIVTY
jgi:catechol 2,3-dioxygenase